MCYPKIRIVEQLDIDKYLGRPNPVELARWEFTSNAVKKECERIKLEKSSFVELKSYLRRKVD